MSVSLYRVLIKKGKRMIMKKIIFLALGICMLFSKVYAFYDDLAEIDVEKIIETVSTEKSLILNSRNAILYDKTYGQILYEKDAYKRVANASTTKILTAIVAYENGDIEDKVRVSKNAASVGGSEINLRSGDVITLGDLIKGLLIHSGNDAAIAIAEHVGGNVENFCDMMNQKAKTLGLESTHFTTPHGLDAENHYSTAYDLAKLAEYLLDINYLANIVKEKNVNIKVNENIRILGTTNEMLSFYEGANGVKTGFTGNAGRCLVTSATRNGRTLISVVLGCGNKKQRTEDSIRLLNYGFENFEIVDVFQNMKKEFEITVKKGKFDRYKIILSGKKYILVHKDEINKLSYKYDIYGEFEAPLIKGKNIGKIHIYVNNNEVSEVLINIPETVEKKTFFDYFKIFSQINIKNYEIRP